MKIVLDTPPASTTINASGNWWGTTDGSVITATTSVTLAGQSLDYTPFLGLGTDTAPGTVGFQPDLSAVTVTTDLAQVGSTGRIQEGLDLVAAGGTLSLLAGTYSEPSATVKVNNLTISAPTGVTGFGTATLDAAVTNGNLTLTGGAAVNMAGNAGNNVLIGNSGNNAITGGGGDDTLTGGGGTDTFNVDGGTDVVSDLNGSEVLVVSAGATATVTVTAAYTAGTGTVNNGTTTLSTNGFTVDLSGVTMGNGFTITNTGGGA
ncbi:MAG: hypothetical protein ACK496_10095, partial [Acidobacteriota bacterium]